MSRSRPKTPITPVTTAVSEAQDKKIWHRRYRRAEKQRIDKDPEAEPLCESHYSDPWKMDKDGKHYRERATAKIFRK
ncbi:hypothetical protein B0G81_3965 [Paraburkholderia sp. BL6665CI2N2]|uniref:hypothetical protein n=1 Tax=Paraburkholderia sp. BL6665CI2N2 TaxID=1938806 RepID=UPI001064F288|nr:hypothetical protein [Paraburkholderia sp. BL6665CI2N2]TDY23583.1 hypothetical protein B0G81_3965 [Paraburkholderia sp. BL6665CI2N2]